MSHNNFTSDCKEEVISVVMKGEIYKEAGLKNSGHKEIESKLFDYLCTLKGYHTRKFVCDYALKFSEDQCSEEEFSATNEWLDSFVLRFSMVKKLQPKKPLEKMEISKVNNSNSTTKNPNPNSPKLHSPNILSSDVELNDSSKESDAVTSSPKGDLEKYLFTVDEYDLDGGESVKSQECKADTSSSNTVLYDADELDYEQTSVQDDSTLGLNETSILNESESIMTNEDDTTEDLNGDNITKSRNEDETTTCTNEDEITTNLNEDNVSDLKGDDTKSLQEDETVSSLNEDETTDNINEDTKNQNEDTEGLNENTKSLNEDETTENLNEDETTESLNEDETTKNLNEDEITKNVSEDETTMNKDDSADNLENISDTTSSSSHQSDSDDVKLESITAPEEILITSSDESLKEEPASSEESEPEQSKVDMKLNEDENTYFKKNCADLEVKVRQNINHCTACFQHINRAIRDEVYGHPVLGVIICKKCSTFYGDGNFQKDSDGFDEFCRWCANGGDLLICDFCTNGFCKVCIKRNAGRSALKEAMTSEQWKCYVCDIKPLFGLRAMKRIILKDLEQDNEKTDALSRLKKKAVVSQNKFANFKLQREKYQKKVHNNTKEKEQCDLMSYMNDMKCMIDQCMKQIEKIEIKFKQNEGSEDAFVTARRRFVRINKNVQNNCRLLLQSYLEVANITEIAVLEDTKEKKKSRLRKVISSENEVDDHQMEMQDIEKETICVVADIHESSENKKKKGLIAKKSTSKRKRSDSPRSHVTAISMKTGRSKVQKLGSGSESLTEAKDGSDNDAFELKRAKLKRKLGKGKSKIESDSDTKTKSLKDLDSDDNVEPVRAAPKRKGRSNSDTETKSLKDLYSDDDEPVTAAPKRKGRSKIESDSDTKTKSLNEFDSDDDVEPVTAAPKRKGRSKLESHSDTKSKPMKSIDSDDAVERLTAAPKRKGRSRLTPDSDKTSKLKNLDSDDTVERLTATPNRKGRAKLEPDNTTNQKNLDSDDAVEPGTPAPKRKGRSIQQSDSDATSTPLKDLSGTDGAADTKTSSPKRKSRARLSKLKSGFDKSPKLFKDASDGDASPKSTKGSSDPEQSPKDLKRGRQKKTEKSKYKSVKGFSDSNSEPTKMESSDSECTRKMRSRHKKVLTGLEDSGTESQSILRGVEAAVDSSDSKDNEPDDSKTDTFSDLVSGKVNLKSKTDNQTLFNIESSEDELDVTSAVESILEDYEDRTKKRKRPSSGPLETARKRTKLSMNKENILRQKNKKAKNSILHSSSDENISKVTKPKAKEKRPVLDETEDYRMKPCNIVVSRLSTSIMDELEEKGFYLHQKAKKSKKVGSSKNYSGDSTSDVEYKRLLNFNIKKSTKKEKKLSSGSDASDEDSDSNDKAAPILKKVTKKKKISGSEKNKKMADMSISNEESGSSEEEMEAEAVLYKDEDLNEKMKRALLLTSEDESSLSDEENGLDDGKSPKKRKKGKKKNEDSDIKKKTYKKGYLSLKISSSSNDSSSESSESSAEASDSISDFESVEKKKRKKRAKQSSDSSDNSDSSDVAAIFKKASRRRIKRGSSSSTDNDKKKIDKKDTPSKRKVRKIMKDEDLLESTKNAAQEEQNRKLRVKERQKLFEKLLKDESIAEEKFSEHLILDFDSEEKKKLICVDERLRKHLKPHQTEGIKFMWDATIESVELLNKDEGGGGCILAHCMGLGKTLQVITFLHTLLTSRKTNVQISNILVCCPVNTIHNWVAEFKQWLKGRLPFDVCELVSSKNNAHRAFKLNDWYQDGGIMIMGYDMYRNLSSMKKHSKKHADIFRKCLVSPGPDLVVCDEGHVLKNEKTALSVALNKLQTTRRIVLTGTPLQNNLKEYHCMINFVKPNLLGSRKEYLNRFVNPIEAGQCKDADVRDVKRMKRRAHILHTMLEGCVQRFDYSVIQPYLPPKYEYVISVQMSKVQCKFYYHYLNNLAQGGPKRSGSGLFVDFSNLSKIWNHPYVLQLDMRRMEIDDDDEVPDEDDLNFINDDSSSASDSESRHRPDPPKPDEAEAPPNPQNSLTDTGKVKRGWWLSVPEENEDPYEMTADVTVGGKIVLLMNILKKCDAVGDKLLLFSQSLLTLDMIEHFLGLIDNRSIPYADDTEPNFKNWIRNRDYLRLDGSTQLDTRKEQIKLFNNEKNDRCRLFLISTRAGGLGINLVGANRVIIFDSSWNPSHDIQSIFRVYRFGQKKPCYVYRFVAQGTMEEKIYSRQVAKLATALRVVDEQQIKRTFRMDELIELYQFTPADVEIREVPKRPEDLILSDLLISNKGVIVDYHEHDSLLENQTEEELTEEERKAAWEDYEMEKQMSNQQRQAVNMGTQMSTDMFAPIEAFNVDAYVKNAQLAASLYPQHQKDWNSQTQRNIYLGAYQHQRALIPKYQHLSRINFELRNRMKVPSLTTAADIDSLGKVQHQLRLLEAAIKRDTNIMAKYMNPNLIRTPVVQNTTVARGVTSTTVPPYRNVAPTIRTVESINRGVTSINRNIVPDKVGENKKSQQNDDIITVIDQSPTKDPLDIT